MESKDEISWASIIACFAHNGAENKALNLFEEMIIQGFELNSVSVISALQACEATLNLDEGKRMHELAVMRGLESDMLVSTALIDMYMNYSSPDKAIEVFKKMPKKDTVCWSCLMGGYVQNGMVDKLMTIFCDVLASGIRPDGVIMVKVLGACSELGVLQQTCSVHGFVIKCGFSNNSFIGTSLIESYAKCGAMDDAIMVFKGTTDRDITVWSSMFAGYELHGQGQEAFELFDQMVNQSVIRPNKVTFLSILAVCSHACLVKQGIEIFSKMVNDYKLKPDSKHYGIVVDLLGRTGQLEKAMEFIHQIPEPVGAHLLGGPAWGLSNSSNVKIAEVAARNLHQLDPNHSGYYALLSNIYAGGGKWDITAHVRTLANEKQPNKVPGKSAIEFRAQVALATTIQSKKKH